MWARLFVLAGEVVGSSAWHLQGRRRRSCDPGSRDCWDWAMWFEVFCLFEILGR